MTRPVATLTRRQALIFYMAAPFVLAIAIGANVFEAREDYLLETRRAEEDSLYMAKESAERQLRALGRIVNPIHAFYRSSKAVSADEFRVFTENIKSLAPEFPFYFGWINSNPLDRSSPSLLVNPDGEVLTIPDDVVGRSAFGISSGISEPQAKPTFLVGDLDLDLNLDSAASLMMPFSNVGANMMHGGAFFVSFSITDVLDTIEATSGVTIRSATIDVGTNVITVPREVAPPVSPVEVTERSLEVDLGGAVLDLSLDVTHQNMAEWLGSRFAGVATTLLASLLLVAMSLVTTRQMLIARNAGRAAAQANFHKTRFLATMSHEMRTPLNGILGMSDLVRKGPLSPVQREQMQTVGRSAEALLSLINQILDFSKIEADAFEIDPVECDLAELVSNIVTGLNILAAHKGLRVIVSMPIDVPRRVRIDALRLSQVIINLLSNAVKFTSEGHVALKVVLEKQDDRQAQIRFAVEDTGIGIPEDKQNEIFMAFRQADVTTTRKFGGTGLGLTIAQRIVAEMGGEISVRSLPGKGSTFSFAIDVDVIPAASPLRREIVLSAAFNVLVVTHDKIVSDCLVRSFRKVGGLAEGSGSVSDALQAIERVEGSAEPFDVVLLDDLAMAAEFRAAIPTDRRLKIGWLRDSTRVGETPSEEEIAASDFICDAPHLPEQIMAKISGSLAHRSLGARAKVELNEEVVRPCEGMKVLLVEDDTVNQIYAAAVLEDLGCAVATADNGRAAVDMARARAYDVVLMDCQMPIMDGYTAAGILKSDMEAGKITRAPIIALTANALTGDRERCLESGMDGYMKKPVREAELRTALVEIVGQPGHRAESEPEQATVVETPADPPAAPLMLTEIVREPKVDEPASSKPADILDVSRFMATRQSMGARFPTLLKTFCSTGPVRMNELRTALANHDFATCARIGHTLKSSAKMLGATRLNPIAKELEDVASRPAPDEAAVADLAKAVEGALTEFTQYLVEINRRQSANRNGGAAKEIKGAA
ncbi:hybrid sensor histidine kinase/response regulator [Palleronia aestuarii]|nr:hybrid sensor histidine kinase/response regulator [Palleronia aestuarii]